jgi:hypothetical protein
VRIAVKGLSISSLSSNIEEDFTFASDDSDFKKDTGTDNKTASIIEQIKEEKRAIKRYRNKRAIRYQGFKSHNTQI